MSKEVNMNYLYKGLGYEYYTASQLWKLGYEAYKMDADFGFDLMAYNQREKTFESSKLDKIYLFQVKMRCDSKVEIKETSAGKRKESCMKFFLGERDFLRLLNEEKGYLVCYFVEKAADGKEEILGEFWLSNKQLKYLKSLDDKSSVDKFFKMDSEEPDKVYLEAIIQTQANPSDSWLRELDEINAAINLLDTETESETINKVRFRTKKIAENIANASIINEKSQCNIYLLRGKTKIWLRKAQMDFAQFNTVTKDSPFR